MASEGVNGTTVYLVVVGLIRRKEITSTALFESCASKIFGLRLLWWVSACRPAFFHKTGTWLSLSGFYPRISLVTFNSWITFSSMTRSRKQHPFFTNSLHSKKATTLATSRPDDLTFNSVPWVILLSIAAEMVSWILLSTVSIVLSICLTIPSGRLLSTNWTYTVFSLVNALLLFLSAAKETWSTRLLLTSTSCLYYSMSC